MKDDKKNKQWIFGSLIFLELALLVVVITSFGPFVSSGVGSSVPVHTTLEVGAVFPEILNISINEGNDVTLTPNSTTSVVCQALVQDWNNDTDIYLVNATLYDPSVTTWDAADNPNDHYSNASCVIDLDTHDAFGKTEDPWHALANCTFDVEYYAKPNPWNCSVYVEDTTNRSNREEDSGNILDLLAVGLPDTINYGIVNSTDVSDEQTVSVENVGNVQLNLTLNGYSDPLVKDNGHAMNCSKGSYPYIDIDYEKFNLTDTTPVVSDLLEFETFYVNLTSTLSPPVYDFQLIPRVTTRSLATQDTYWRIYVPKGLAGTCEGYIDFGATAGVGI